MKLCNFFKEYIFIGFLGTISSVVGIGSGLSNIFGGGSSGGSGYSGPPIYTPTGLGSADTSWQNLLNNNVGNQNNLTSLINPALLSSYQNLNGIDYSTLLNAGNQAGNQYSNLASMYGSTGNNQMAMGNQQYEQGQNIYNLATDPQNALYNQTLGQGLETERAGQALRGLGNSAAGQGLEDQFTNNFNIDWQNNQLQRGIQGLQASQSGNNVANADYTAGLQNYGAVPNATLQSAQAPISAQTQAYGAPATNATNYANQFDTTNLSPSSSLMSGIIPYLNYGAGAQNSYSNQQMANNNYANSQQSSGLTSLMSGLNGFSNTNAGNSVGSWLSNLWGGSGSSGGSSQSPMTSSGLDSYLTGGNYWG